MAKVGDIVEVEWLDAVCDWDTTEAHEASDLPTMFTYGELLALTPKFVRVGQERVDDGKGAPPKYRGITTIPKPWTIKILKRG